MNRNFALALVLSFVPTIVDAQSPPASGMGSGGTGAAPVVRKPAKVKKHPRYSSGVPVTAGAPNGVRINSAGEVLFDEP